MHLPQFCDDHDLAMIFSQAAQQRQGSDRRWIMHEEGAAWQQERDWTLSSDLRARQGGELILRARLGRMGLGDPRNYDDAFNLYGKPSVTLSRISSKRRRVSCQLLQGKLPTSVNFLLLTPLTHLLVTVASEQDDDQQALVIVHTILAFGCLLASLWPLFVCAAGRPAG